MIDVILQPPPRDWECSRCTVTERTGHNVMNRFHRCAGMAGLEAPLIPAGSGARLVAVERQDYIGREDVLYDGNGRPIMSVMVKRPDGSNDTVVYAPTAHGRANLQ